MRAIKFLYFLPFRLKLAFIHIRSFFMKMRIKWLENQNRQLKESIRYHDERIAEQMRRK